MEANLSLNKKKQQSRSVMWRYFDKHPDDENLAVCKICNVIFRWSNKTYNLSQHLVRKHPKSYHEAVAQKDREQQRAGRDNSSQMMSKIRGPKQSSVVWNYFDKDTAGHNMAKCKNCEKWVVRASSTTNLFNHLKSKHFSLYVEAMSLKKASMYEENKKMLNEVPTSFSSDASQSDKRNSSYQPKTEASFVASGSRSASSSKSKAHTSSDMTKIPAHKCLMKLLAVHLLPPSIVDLKEFKEFSKALNCRYELPSKKTILRTMIPQLVMETRSKVKQKVDKASSFALSIEMWVYRQTQRYHTVMAHFINNAWEASSVILDSFDSTDKITSESISEEIKRITEEWAVGNKTISVTSDQSDSDITTAVLLMGWEHLSCFGHRLNTVILTALGSVPEIVLIQKKARDTVDFFDKDSKAYDVLISVQQQHSLPQHKLKQEVESQWVSIFYMMERMLEQYEAVNTVLCYLGRETMCLCDDEIELLRLVVDTLCPFEAAVKELFSDDYSAMSKVIPLTNVLQEVTSCEKEENSPPLPGPVVTLRDALLQQMQTQYINLESSVTLAVTTLLDPRFKHHAFTDATALETAKQRLLQEMITMSSSSAEQNGELNTPLETAAASAKPRVASLWNSFDRKVCEAGAQKTTTSEADNECGRYFKEAVISRSADPLQWWRVNQVQFPNLKKLAQKYLSIPANSISTSRLFSKWGEEFEKRRNVIKPCDLNAMVFLSSNVAIK